jgi:hypothetical protein
LLATYDIRNLYPRHTKRFANLGLRYAAGREELTDLSNLLGSQATARRSLLARHIEHVVAVWCSE